jgi:hypothetical protein
MKLFSWLNLRRSVKSEHNRDNPIDKHRNITFIRKYSDCGGHLPEVVDDRTWNDLELDHVYSFIDRTLTKTGEQYLYRLLRKEQPNSQKEMLNYAVRFYTSNPDKLKATAVILNKYETATTYFLPELLYEKSYNLVPGWTKVMGFLPPALFLLSFSNNVFFLPLAFVLLMNTFIHYYLKAKTNLHQHEFLNIRALYRAFNGISKLENSHQQLSKSELTMFKRIAKKCFYLSINTENADELSSVLFYIVEIIKASVLYDALQYNSTIKLIEKNAGILQKAFEYVGISDTAQSLSCLKKDHGLVEPVPSSDNCLILENALHPLIKGCIANSIVMSDQNVVITGGNMSGKTSFLKTIGVNIVLAKTINCAFCDYIKLPVIKVVSSISNNESLLSGKSFFMDELTRIYDIVSGNDGSHLPHLVLIDEIFRGTNAIDRISLAAATLLYLGNTDSKVMVTTHDLDLIALLKNKYDTYCFDNDFAEGQILFDFKIKKGIQRRTNVVELIKMLNFPVELVASTLSYRKQLINTRKKQGNV